MLSTTRLDLENFPFQFTDRQTDRGTNGRTDRQTDGRTDRRANGWSGGRKDLGKDKGRTKVQFLRTDGRTHRRIGTDSSAKKRQTERRREGRTDRHTNKQIMRSQLDAGAQEIHTTRAVLDEKSKFV